MPVFFLGCGQNQRSYSGGSLESDGSFSSPLPKRLQKHLNASLEAEVDVEGRIIPLDVDLDGTGACGTIGICGRISGISKGEQKFVLRYKINNVVVATSSATGTIVEGTASPIVFSDLLYPDDDGDGFTNFAEIEVGTDPLLASSRPPVESPRFSANYIMSEEVGISPVVGTASSTNYFIR